MARGRPRERFCRLGHDKQLPHGSYEAMKDGYIYDKCARCVQLQSAAYYRNNKHRWRARYDAKRKLNNVST